MTPRPDAAIAWLQGIAPLGTYYASDARAILAYIKELEGDRDARKRQWDRAVDHLQRHHAIAADARAMLDNNGFGPNTSQRQRIDNILLEIACGPEVAQRAAQRDAGDLNQG